MNTRHLAILGATGSIGDNTLEVVRANPDRLKVVAIASKENFEKLAKIANEFDIRHVALYDTEAYKEAKHSGLFCGRKLYSGKEGLAEIASLPEADTTVAAVVGTNALEPTLTAIRSKKDIALANKELLVMAGKFVMGEARQNGVRILPLDSEHNAIFQCLNGERRQDIAKLIITASGGMFRDFTREQMLSIRPEHALKHPNWAMGPKVTIDSSTLANKGMEVIEASWLFDMPAEKIQVIVQRESLVHSMVQFIDGSILAHMSPPSMTFAIAHSLMYPERGKKVYEPLDFTKTICMNFCPPDTKRFPCLKYAYRALKLGGTATTVFNASNEVAVAKFMENKLPWIKISEVVGKCIDKLGGEDPHSIEDVIECDAHARIVASEIASAIVN